MSYLKSGTIFLLALVIATSSFSQAASYIDPAAAYMRILLEKNGTSGYQQEGNFKVVGTAALYGERITGNVYTPNGAAQNVKINYNTFKQRLEIYYPNQENPLLKAMEEVDSFRLIASDSTQFHEDLVFVNSKLIDPSSKSMFCLLIAPGPKYDLYKVYHGTLGYVSTNYIQSELRQYELEYDYFYTDKTKNKLTKIKTSASALKKEFKDVKDVSPFLEGTGLNRNPEKELRRVFAGLNS